MFKHLKSHNACSFYVFWEKLGLRSRLRVSLILKYSWGWHMSSMVSIFLEMGLGTIFWVINIMCSWKQAQFLVMCVHFSINWKNIKLVKKTNRSEAIYFRSHWAMSSPPGTAFYAIMMAGRQLCARIRAAPSLSTYYRFQLLGDLFLGESYQWADRSGRNWATRGFSVWPNFS